jgi:peroxiredoxin
VNQTFIIDYDGNIIYAFIHKVWRPDSSLVPSAG